MLEPATLTLIFGILIGLWFGTGIAPALLVWIKNPNEGVLWKTWATVMCLAEGPIGFAAMREWLD